MQYKKNALWKQAELTSNPGFISYYSVTLCVPTDLCGFQFMRCKTRKPPLYSGLAAFSIKGQTVNIFSFVGYTITIQLCSRSPREATDHTHSCA